MKKLFAVSTSTLGGAVLMLILSTALGDKAPWFVERLYASAGEVYALSLNVEDIFAASRSSDELSDSKYYIDRLRNFYIELPPEDWDITTTDPGDFLRGLSAADVPFIHYSLSAFFAMMQPPQLRQGDVVTVSVRPPGGSRMLSFTKESRFDGVPLDLNPFEDRAFAKAAIRAGATMMGLDTADVDEVLAEETEEAREEFEEAWESMREQGEIFVESHWPGEKEVQAGIRITTFRTQVFASNPIASVLEQGDKLSLWSRFGFLQLANPEIASFNIRKIDVSTDNRVLLLDASARLEELVVDGIETKEVDLVKVFLVAMENELIYVVSLTYVYSPGTSRRVVENAERIFRSFRILA